ncbi:MAG TPA: hypothetical protein VIU33_08970 [Nitrospiria bacterium]
MLEKLTGKTEAKIMEEVQQGLGDWPMGMPELESGLLENQKFAKATIEHFGTRRPSVFSREDILAIDLRFRGTRSAVREFEMDGYRQKIQVVFDLLDEKP